MQWIGWLLAGIAGMIVGLGWRPYRHWMRRREVERAIAMFRLQREVLEARFFDMASRLGKPRGLRWLDCNWQPAVTYGRDRGTRQLTAFVAVNVRFEAIEGSDMEDVAAVGTVRDAAALFHYRAGRWGTGGRALFNLNPQDALTRLEDQFEPLSINASNASR